MKISSSALNDLRETLKLEIGSKNSDKLSDEDLNYIGNFLLEVFKQGLKRRSIPKI